MDCRTSPEKRQTALWSSARMSLIRAAAAVPKAPVFICRFPNRCGACWRTGNHLYSGLLVISIGKRSLRGQGGAHRFHRRPLLQRKICRTGRLSAGTGSGFFGTEQAPGLVKAKKLPIISNSPSAAFSKVACQVKVNGVPAQMDGRNFFAEIELKTESQSPVTASVMLPTAFIRMICQLGIRAFENRSACGC